MSETLLENASNKINCNYNHNRIIFTFNFLLKGPKYLLSIRFFLSLIAFFALALQYSQKINMRYFKRNLNQKNKTI